MSFLSPWFLLGGLAVGIPIWLHLIRREQPVRLPFSSLMFFQRIPVKSTSRQRLKYLLLLATRCLVILLIALAFARPYFPFASAAFAGKAKQKNLVVLLDTSLSMKYGDRWERAVAAARDALGSLGELDRAQIVTFGAEYEIRNLPTSDKAALRAVLDKIEGPTASATSYAQAFRGTEKIADDLRQPVSVVLISDLQKSGLGLQQGFPSGPVAEFKLVDVAGKNVPNWTVEHARSHRVIYRTRYPDRIVAEVRGYGTPATSKDVTLTLGGKLAGRKKVDVPASGVATVSFDGFDVPLGSNEGEIKIDSSDALPQDDSFHFVLERRDPYKLLFLHEPGELSELFFFRAALAAEADSPFTIDARNTFEGAAATLSSYTLVILSNISTPPPALISSLREFVQRGGGALVTLGSRFPAPSLETDLKEIWPGKGLEKKLMTEDRERMVLLGQFDKDHPLFAEFQEPGAAQSLRSTRTFAYVRMQPDGTVPLRFSNGDPALIEKQAGKGRVLLYASSFDNVWSDFPLHPAFIPFLHQMIRYTAQLADEPAAYTLPAAVALKNYHLASGAPSLPQNWDVMGPDGSRAVPLDPKDRTDFLPLRQAGFYQLRQSDSSHLVAANSDPRESDLTQLSPEDRALWTANASGGAETAAALGVESAKRQTVWWTLLVIAFLLALLEAYLANQYLGRRVTTASDETKENAYAG